MLYLAAPFLLLGLLVAGLLHVLMPARWIERWLGRPGLAGVSLAALVGVPLPICSCGVVPIAVELRRKRASDPASLSFLITTPESGVDSILLTLATMGPVMAIARPIAAFASAVFGGTLASVFLPGPGSGGQAETRASCGSEVEEHGSDGACDRCHPAQPESSHGLGYAKADEALAVLETWLRHPLTAAASPRGLWRAVFRPALRYGFRELLDELAFWLALGLLLAGALTVALPADLAARGWGSGIWPMLAMLLVGIPLYVCASASTPIAAALMAKGLAPGAALVFLLAGPATNAAALVLLSKTFGRRFVLIYVASVAVGALAAGLVLDGLILGFGWSISLPAAQASTERLSLFGLLCAALLLGLLAWSFARGSLRSGWGDLVASVRGLWALVATRR